MNARNRRERKYTSELSDRTDYTRTMEHPLLRTIREIRKNSADNTRSTIRGDYEFEEQFYQELEEQRFESWLWNY